MAYGKHEWEHGEIITAEKLNNMEEGIAAADAREISAVATASVENSAGEPSCEVKATGSVSSIAFDFAFKGLKGETGEKGEKGDAGEKGAGAPTIKACEISIAGTEIRGKLTLSDESSVEITGTYSPDEASAEEGEDEEEEAAIEDEEKDAKDEESQAAGGTAENEDENNED